jgi:membrane associated rhomboid family serine protease
MDEATRCYRHKDRETRVTCSECGRGICPDCMVFAPVGIRCPDHAGTESAPGRAARRARTVSLEGQGALVTKTLIALNVGIYLLQLAMGAPLSGDAGRIFEEGALYGPLVADGEWWRLITAAFLHLGVLHLGFNMLALWWFGPPLEYVLGRGRFLLLYLVSGLAGSAGALIATPNSVTVGASGAIFGILGAALVLERQRTYVFGGAALTIIVLNIVFSLALAGSGISLGGHLGGLAGGALAMLVMTRFGRAHAIYGRSGLVGILGVVAIGALSVILSYWKVRGLA